MTVAILSTNSSSIKSSTVYNTLFAPTPQQTHSPTPTTLSKYLLSYTICSHLHYLLSPSIKLSTHLLKMLSPILLTSTQSISFSILILNYTIYRLVLFITG